MRLAGSVVRGGGFTKGDERSYIKPLFEPLSNAGFAWFTINYRLAPQHRWPACAEDVETVIRGMNLHVGSSRSAIGVSLKAGKPANLGLVQISVAVRIK